MQQNCYLLYADQLSIIVTRASAARIVSARNKAAVQKAPGNSLCSVISRAAHSKHRIKGSFIPVTGICLEQYIPCPITLVLHFLIYKKTLFFSPHFCHSCSSQILVSGQPMTICTTYHPISNTFHVASLSVGSAHFLLCW